MTLFKPNFTKIIKAKVLSLAVLAAVFFSFSMPQVVEAQKGENELISAIKDIFAQSENPTFPVAEDRKPAKTIWVTVTAYSSTVDQCDDTPCVTANGFDLCQNYEETAAADTIAANFMKFGAQVRLPEVSGNKILVVRDRMNARYGYGRIDVWMPTREMAKEFGVKRVKMEIF